ncbi:MAG: hypothetical protein ABIT05_11195, partial [Chitinophagaceae bacterium]
MPQNADCVTVNTISQGTSVIRKSLLLMYLLIGTFFMSYGQNPQADIDQANNGRDNAPNEPMAWVNGNLNETQNHYIEGQSIPYRAILDRFKINCSTKIRIAFDTRNSQHMAIDYMTSYNQPGPHPTVFPGHTLPQETINPLAGLSGSFSGPSTYTIPSPGTINTPVPGQAQASFNALTAAQKLFTMWNGTVTNMTWVIQPDYAEANTSFEAIMEITFTPTALPVVMAWGGHIAARVDWGSNANGSRSAGGIPGSPYHMRLKDWDVTGINSQNCNAQFTSIGNQDRSLQISALPCTGLVAGNILTDFSQYDNNNTIGLNVIPSGGYAPYTFAWTASAGITLNDPTLQSPTATVVGNASTATFTVVITDLIGCSITKTITVALTPRPCGINGPDNVCPSSLDQFSFPYGGAQSITWSVTGNGTISGSNTGTPVTIAAGNVCGGQYIVTVTAVFPNETKVCTKTVTVLTPPQATFSNPPPNITVACGGVQTLVNLTYSNGGQGGCSIGGTAVGQRSGSFTSCGGTLTDTWTFTDLCNRTITHTRVITVSPAPFPTYTNPPGNINLDACSSPTPQVSTISYSNGQSGDCLLSGTVQSTIVLTSGAAPCQRVYTETWTVMVCNQPLTHSRTITVPPAPQAVFINPPGNTTVPCSQAPSTSGSNPLSYSNGLTGSCAISGTANSVITGSHTICGGTYTETWTFNDPCNRGTTTHFRTITVSAAPQATFTEPLPGNINVSCGGIPAISLLDYSNGQTSGCSISGSVTSSQTTAPGICGGTVTETWTFTDLCGRTINHTRTITVAAAAQAHFTSTPGPVTVACGAIPAPTCLAYTNDGAGGCVIAGCVTSTQTSAPGLCGGQVTETWTFVDACQRTISTSRVITV